VEAVGKRVSKPVVKLDREKLVAEYGRDLADQIIADAERDDVGKRPGDAAEIETR
jgi:hypothetical protein